MRRILLKKQLAEIFRSYFYDAKKNRARSHVGTMGLFAFFAVGMVFIAGVFGFLAWMLCQPLVQAGLGWLYFALMGILSVLLGTFGGVFNTYAQLYLARDNDLLLSLPIPVGDILFARLLGVYLMGLLYSAVVFLPAVLVYYAVVPMRGGCVAAPLVLLVLVSVFVLSLSCLLGWVVAKARQKLRNKSLVTVAVSLLFFGAYYFVCFRAQAILQSFLNNAAMYGQALRKIAPLYAFGRAGEGNWWALAAVTGVVLALFFLLWRGLQRGFLGIATAQDHAARKARRQRRTRVRSADAALVRREFGRLFSDANYVLNCSLATVFLLVIAVVLLMRGAQLRAMLTGMQLPDAFSECVPVMLAAAVCLVASMNDLCVPSVSLDAKTLWLVQSLPLRPWRILRAKLTVQLVMTLPAALLCTLCGAAALEQPVVRMLPAAGIVLLFCFAKACFDLTLGLKMPNLHWTSEITVIKQSLAVMVTMLVGWGAAAALGGGYFLAPQLGPYGYAALACTLLTAVSVWLLVWLRKQGAARFAAL